MTSRRTRRRVLAAWTSLVVTGGGMTLWLQDGTRDAPVSWQKVEPQRDVAPPGDVPTGYVSTECGGSPEAEKDDPRDGGITSSDCVVIVPE